jgi:hypothetical protein
MFRRTLLLATSLGVAAPALACGPLPGHRPPVAAAARCAPDALAGEWIAPNGLRVRIVDAGDRQFSWLALRLERDGGVVGLVYSDIRRAGDCRYAARRHFELDEGLHPAPPHSVELTLDPATGELLDDYHYTSPLRLRRAPR